MLCSACRGLELNNFDFDLNPELSRWWSEHKKLDAARLKAEIAHEMEFKKVQEICKKPLADITAAEKVLLKKHGVL